MFNKCNVGVIVILPLHIISSFFIHKKVFDYFFLSVEHGDRDGLVKLSLVFLYMLNVNVVLKP